MEKDGEISEEEEEERSRDLLKEAEEEEEAEAALKKLTSFHLKHHNERVIRKNIFGNDVAVEYRKMPPLGSSLFINDIPMTNANTYVSRTKSLQHEWGLFAKKKFQRGDKILKYDGDRVSRADLSDNPIYKNSGYFLSYPTSYINETKSKMPHQYNRRIVGIHAYPYVNINPKLRLAGFANHSKKKANAETRSEYTEKAGVITMNLYATKDIKIGKEILWHYGDAYFRGKFIDLSEKQTIIYSILSTGNQCCHCYNTNVKVEEEYPYCGQFCDSDCQNEFYLK
jgi:hypothetical protein